MLHALAAQNRQDRCGLAVRFRRQLFEYLYMICRRSFIAWQAAILRAWPEQLMSALNLPAALASPRWHWSVQSPKRSMLQNAALSVLKLGTSHLTKNLRQNEVVAHWFIGAIA